MAAAPLVQGLPDDLEEAILRLKRERNAILLAHYYQESEIQDLADVVGDSLKLARAAQEVDCDVIAFCGVHFMAETAKILNPDRTVVVPDLDAGCSLSEGCPAADFEKFIAQHPGAKVVTYINSSAEVKAMSDLICTSSNAVQMVQHFAGQPVIFAPDRHLARWVAKEANRPDLIVWQGVCIVHEQFSAKRLAELRVRHPDAEVLAHPECTDAVLSQADYIGSTSGIIDHAVEVRGEDPHHRHRGRRVPPDREARAGQAAAPGARRRRELRLQPLSLHAPQHDGEALPRAPGPAARGHGARGDPREGAAAHREDAAALRMRPAVRTVACVP